MFEYSHFYNFDSSDEEGETSNDENGTVGELVLNNGSVIGHRSLWKYFKQSFNPRREIILSRRQKQINQHRLSIKVIYSLLNLYV